MLKTMKTHCVASCKSVALSIAVTLSFVIGCSSQMQSSTPPNPQSDSIDSIGYNIYDGASGFTADNRSKNNQPHPFGINPICGPISEPPSSEKQNRDDKQGDENGDPDDTKEDSRPTPDELLGTITDHAEYEFKVTEHDVYEIDEKIASFDGNGFYGPKLYPFMGETDENAIVFDLESGNPVMLRYDKRKIKFPMEHFNAFSELRYLSLKNRSYDYKNKKKWFYKAIGNFSELESLVMLDLSENHISKLENLEALEQLQWLNLSNNRLKTLEGIGVLKNLKGLYLSKNKIEVVGSLKGLDSLIEINLSQNGTKDISGLLDAPALKRVTIHSNKLNKMDKNTREVLSELKSRGVKIWGA